MDFVAKLAEVIKKRWNLRRSYSWKKRSLDYNGGWFPGMIAGILGYNYLADHC
jgi:hypothetical protein